MSFVLVQVIVGGLLLGAVYALFSVGLTLVWGMMNIVNFAHGDFVMLGMYVAYVVYTLMAGGPILGAPLATLVLATVGVVVHFALIRFRGEEIAGQRAFAIVRKGLALSPEGWRLFVQQSVENNLMLGATPLHDKSRQATVRQRVYEIFPRLKERRNQRAGITSGGERQMA